MYEYTSTLCSFFSYWLTGIPDAERVGFPRQEGQVKLRIGLCQRSRKIHIQPDLAFGEPVLAPPTGLCKHAEKPTVSVQNGFKTVSGNEYFVATTLLLRVVPYKVPKLTQHTRYTVVCSCSGVTIGHTTVLMYY